MTIDYHYLKQHVFPEVRANLDAREAMLYALSLGVGQDPLDPASLPYVYEEAPGALKVLPAMAVVLGYPGSWARDPAAGVDYAKVVHGEQRMRLHQPLRMGETVGRNRITHVIDKGRGKGALLVVQRELETRQGDLIATVSQVVFCRGDGGYSEAMGGQPSDQPLPPLVAAPTHRPPDCCDDQRTRPEAALLYRLMGDRNPLHADPRAAAAAAFPRPILHGLASYGIACRALLRQCCADDPERLRSLDVRFAAPVFPGETLRTEIWKDGDRLRFQVRVVERDTIVLSHGEAAVA